MLHDIFGIDSYWPFLQIFDFTIW